MKTIQENFALLTGISLSKVDKQGITKIFEYPELCKLTETQKQKVAGLNEFYREYSIVAYVKEKTIITGVSVAKELVKNLYKNVVENEYFCVIFLNNSGMYIAHKHISKGSVSECPIYMREIIKEVLNHNASSVILCHNHPGGMLEASNADIRVTKDVIEACKTIHVNVLDHVIVTADGDAISLKETNREVFRGD